MRLSLFLVLVLGCFTMKGQSIKNVNLSLNFGSAYNAPTYLKIYQENLTDIELTANFATEGFKNPVYWDYKLEVETEKYIYGLRSTHHKLVLRNPTPEIDNFSITHGYNLFSVYFGWKKKYFDVLAGGGIAFSHPEGVINGNYIALEEGIRLYGGKYRLTGPNFEAAIRKKVYLYKRLYLNGGIRFTAGYAKPKIIDGYVETYPISFHATAGLGFDLYRKE